MSAASFDAIIWFTEAAFVVMGAGMFVVLVVKVRRLLKNRKKITPA